MPVVDQTAVQLPRELAEDRAPLLVPRRGRGRRRRGRDFDDAFDDLDGAEPRCGCSSLLPGPLPTGCRAPLGHRATRLGLERAEAPPALRGGRAAVLCRGVLRAGRARGSRCARGRVPSLLDPTLSLLLAATFLLTAGIGTRHVTSRRAPGLEGVTTSGWHPECMRCVRSSAWLLEKMCSAMPELTRSLAGGGAEDRVAGGRTSMRRHLGPAAFSNPARPEAARKSGGVRSLQLTPTGCSKRAAAHLDQS